MECEHKNVIHSPFERGKLLNFICPDCGYAWTESLADDLWTDNPKTEQEAFERGVWKCVKQRRGKK
jgi:hypothetical protein